MAPDLGRICWWDLVSEDVAGAQAMLTRLLQWQVTARSIGDEVYPVAGQGGTRWCGFVGLPGDRQLPDHWLPYLSVADLDATCAAVLAGGGQVLSGREVVSGFGEYAVCEDPLGAWFAVHRHERVTKQSPPPWPEPPRMTGAPWGAVLSSPDPEQSAAFHRALLGWQCADTAGDLAIQLADGSPTALTICPLPDGDLLGAVSQRDGGAVRPRARWVPVFTCGDIAEMLLDGAELVLGPWPGSEALCLEGDAVPPLLLRELPPG